MIESKALMELIQVLGCGILSIHRLNIVAIAACQTHGLTVAVQLPCLHVCGRSGFTNNHSVFLWCVCIVRRVIVEVMDIS